MREVKISVKDLLYRILLKWRIMIIFAVVFAIAGSGVSLYATKKSSQKKIDEELEEALALEEQQAADAAAWEASISTTSKIDAMDRAALEEYIGQAKALLTPAQLRQADLAYDTYVQVYVQEDDNIDYLKNSEKMQLDPYAVPTLVMSYLISMDSSSEIAANTVATSYQSLLFTDSLYEEISEAAGWQISDARELVSGYVSGDYLKINIEASSTEECDIIAEVINSRVESLKTQVQRTYGKFTVTPDTKSYTEVIDAGIISTRQGYLNNLNTSLSIYNNMYSWLNDNQKNYVYALITLYNMDEPAAAEPAVESAEEDTAEETAVEANEASDGTAQTEEKASDVIRAKKAKSKILPIYIVLGAVAGILVLALIELIAYIFSVSVKTEIDLEETLGLNVIASVEGEGKKKFLGAVDKLFSKIFYRRRYRFTTEDTYKMIASAVRISAKKNGFTSVYITGSAADELSGKVIDDLADLIKVDNVRITGGSSVLCDADSLEQLSASDCVLLVEKLGLSRFDEVAKEITLAEENNVRVIGAVAVF